MLSIKSVTNLLRSAVALPRTTSPVICIPVANLYNFAPPPKFRDIEFPERKKLRVMEKVPQYPPTLRPFRLQKRLRYMRGPELVHTELLHKQFGIVATCGGRLKHGHFEMIRFTIGRKMDVNRMFAIWRVDAPWQPITKRSLGTRMGGGKSPIDHYATPVKAGRIIVEVGGNCEYFEVSRWLKDIANKLPFKAKAISYEKMMKRRALEEKLERENLNPWTFKYVVQNNIGGCHNWISPVDLKWFGKYN